MGKTLPRQNQENDVCCGGGGCGGVLSRHATTRATNTGKSERQDVATIKTSQQFKWRAFWSSRLPHT